MVPLSVDPRSGALQGSLGKHPTFASVGPVIRRPFRFPLALKCRLVLTVATSSLRRGCFRLPLRAAVAYRLHASSTPRSDSHFLSILSSRSPCALTSPVIAATSRQSWLTPPRLNEHLSVVALNDDLCVVVPIVVPLNDDG